MFKLNKLLPILLFIFSSAAGLFAADSNLVTLTVFCNIEGAIVQVNNTTMGVVEDGVVSKELASNNNVKIKIEAEGYYPAEKKIDLDDSITVEIELIPHYAVSGGMKYTFGGGSMSSIYYRWYPLTNLIFLDFGIGATLQNTNEFYLQSFFQFDAGYYFLDEHSFIRPYGGLKMIAPVFAYIQMPGGTSKVDIVGWQSDTLTGFPDSETGLGDIDCGLLLGSDICLSQNLFLGLELDIFFNTTRQADDSAPLGVLDWFLSPFIEMGNVITLDPIYQFGVNVTYQLPPADSKDEGASE